MTSRSITPENTYRIDPEAAEELWRAALKAAPDFAPDFHQSDDGVEAAVKVARSMAATCLASEGALRAAAAELNAEGNSQDVLLVQGLPVLPGAAGIEVMHDNTLPDESARAMGLAAIAVTSLFGPPIGYRRDEGTVSTFMMQVAPSLKSNHSIVGSTRAGGWHTEFGASAFKPSVVLLTGIRAGDAATQFVPARRVVSYLERTDPVLLERLREPRFATPSKYLPDEHTRGPLITETENGPALVLGEHYRDMQDPGDEEARWAIDTLDAVLQNPELSVEHRIAPGEAFAFRNQTGLHARTAFTDRSRWLMRTLAGKPGMPTIIEHEDIRKT